MPFHVTVKRGFRTAAAFNLTDRELREQVVGPWSGGKAIELGGREWDPEEARIIVLEGPHLDPPDLAYGQGWNNATKTSRDVTRAVFGLERGAAPAGDAVAVLGGGEALTGFLAALGLAPVAWSAVRAELLAGTELDADAAVVVLGDAAPIDVGLAVGALGARAILVQVGDGAPPAELAGLGVIRLDGGGSAPLHALAQRLRAAGCAVAPVDGWDAPGRF